MVCDVNMSFLLVSGTSYKFHTTIRDFYFSCSTHISGMAACQQKSDMTSQNRFNVNPLWLTQERFRAGVFNMVLNKLLYYAQSDAGEIQRPVMLRWLCKHVVFACVVFYDCLLLWCLYISLTTAEVHTRRVSSPGMRNVSCRISSHSAQLRAG